MKKAFLWIMALCLSISLASSSLATSGHYRIQGGFSQLFPSGQGDSDAKATAAPLSGGSALFNATVRNYTYSERGNASDYLWIDGWAITRGYLQSEDRFCAIGRKGAFETPLPLSNTFPQAIIPAGNAFIFFSKNDKDDLCWMIQEPGKEPKKVLGISDSVIYADETQILYLTVGTGDGTNISLRSIDRKTNKMEGLARFEALTWPTAMLPDKSVLIYNQGENRVEAWKDGKTETLFETEEPLFGVYLFGKDVWAQFEHEIGLLENGNINFRIPGSVESVYQANGMAAVILSFPGSSEYDLVLINDLQKAYVRAAYIPAALTAVEFHENEKLSVCQVEEKFEFDVPAESEWIPFGYYDVASARDAVPGQPAAPAAPPAPPAAIPSISTPAAPKDTPSVSTTADGEKEPDWDSMITITIPANYAMNMDEANTMAEAEALGIYCTANRDSSYTYVMTEEQQKAILEKRAGELNASLNQLVTMDAYAAIFSKAEANEDFSKITLTMDGAKAEDSMAVLAIWILGLVAPSYQALNGLEEPITQIILVDAASGKIIKTLTAPNDLLQ